MNTISTHTHVHTHIHCILRLGFAVDVGEEAWGLCTLSQCSAIKPTPALKVCVYLMKKRKRRRTKKRTKRRMKRRKRRRKTHLSYLALGKAAQTSHLAAGALSRCLEGTQQGVSVPACPTRTSVLQGSVWSMGDPGGPGCLGSPQLGQLCTWSPERYFAAPCPA